MAERKRAREIDEYELRPRTKQEQMTPQLPSTSTKKTKVDRPRKKQGYLQQYRSNLVSTATFFETLQLEGKHTEQLKKTPFWYMFQSLILKKVNKKECRKFDDDAVEIIQTYDATSKTFRIGHKNLTVQSSDISLIFGIQCGDKAMNLSYATKRDTKFVKRRFAKTKRLTAPILKDALNRALQGKKQADFEDVARILCLYLCVTLFFATTGTSIGWVYAKYIEDLDKIKTFEWSNAIQGTLMSSIHKLHKSPEKVTGCVIVLLYWLCEHSTIMQEDVEEEFPRFLKWNLSKLNKKMKSKRLKLLTKDEVLGGELNKTKSEENLFGNSKLKKERRKSKGKEIQIIEEKEASEQEETGSTREETTETENEEGEETGSTREETTETGSTREETPESADESGKHEEEEQSEEGKNVQKQTGKENEELYQLEVRDLFQNEMQNMKKLCDVAVEQEMKFGKSETDNIEIEPQQQQSTQPSDGKEDDTLKMINFLENENKNLKVLVQNKDCTIVELQKQITKVFDEKYGQEQQFIEAMEEKEALIQEMKSKIREMEEERKNMLDQLQELAVQKVAQSFNQEIQDPPRTTIEEKSTDNRMSLNENMVDEQKARLALTKVFCSEISPPEAVEDKLFKKILQMLDPELQVSVDCVGRKCLEFFKEEKATIKQTLRNLDGQISLSVDILSSAKPGKSGSDYLCLTAYFIDDNWELQKWILNFTCLGHQSEDSPHEVILNSLKEWEIENKISTITMSNSSLYDETIEIVKNHIRGKELPLNGRLFRVYCCSDIVSLMVQDANKEISYIVDKIGTLYTFEEPEPSWYYKNNQIKDALILKSAGVFAYRCRDSWYDKPSAQEWRKVDSISRLVDDIYDTVFPLFETGYSTANIYLHHLQELRAYLIRESTSSNTFVSNVIKNLLQSFSEYMNNMYLVLAIALVMDPRFKMKYIEFSSKKFEGNDSNSPVTMVLEAIHNLYNDYVKIENDSNDSLSLLREFNQFLLSTGQVKSELDLYMEEPVLGWSQNFNALSWWKTASSKYPTLSKMARDCLAIPISLATSDKAFYTQKREVNEGMLSLGPDLMNAVMCIQSWFVKHERDFREKNVSLIS